ncbi:ras protein [Mycena leptocephala]|nr:ras protein [Mycena leptocephala]
MDQWKIVLLGERDAGKTELAVQFALNCSECLPQTFIVDDRMCFVEVIDLPLKVLRTLRDQWIRGPGIHAGLLIASRATFDRLEVFHRSMQKKGDPVFMLVGNKLDKAFEREVSKDEGAALARRFGCEFIETSAKTAQNVDRAFTNLVRALRQRES